MGLRYRKSIPLVPGLVRLNISTSGFSLSFGPKGKNVSVGTNGIYGNIGLGKGMSYRTKLLGLPRNRRAAAFHKFIKLIMTLVIAVYLLSQFADPLAEWLTVVQEKITAATDSARAKK